MSKQLGILFKPEMVRAILEGRKAQTRRGLPIHPTIDQSQLFEPSFDDGNSNLYFRIQVDGKDILIKPIKCPWQVGDYLYVKETWWQYGHWEHVVPHEGTFEGDTEWKRGAGEIKFLTDHPTAPDITYPGHIKSLWRKMSSLFLAQKDARIWLKITNVRVERLLDISHADAIYEGVASMMHYDERVFYDYMSKGHDMDIDAIESYFSLWDSINGAGSHKENPWVWVIEFERCEKP